MLDIMNKGHKLKNVKENKTILFTDPTEENFKKPKGTPRQQPYCVFCKKTDHRLDICSRFRTETVKNRLRFVKENRLCFGCLRRGHESKDCQRRLSCSACYKKHPTWHRNRANETSVEHHHHLRAARRQRKNLKPASKRV